MDRCKCGHREDEHAHEFDTSPTLGGNLVTICHGGATRWVLNCCCTLFRQTGGG